MEESPFRDNWSWFGFDGEADTDVDYSWFRVQDGLTFDGINSVISDCTLYYSSRKPNLFLIRSPKIADELWDSTDCNFRIVPEIPAAIEVSSERRIFIIWGCSQTFLELLEKEKKLAPNSLEGKFTDGIPIEYNRTTVRHDKNITVE